MPSMKISGSTSVGDSRESGGFRRTVVWQLAFFLFVACGVPVQSQDIKFKHLTAEDGLSHGNVTSILQDSKGFMWFGTYDGLNLWDGQTFRVFKNIPGDTSSLQNNHVRRIYEDRSGILWTCTHGGGLSQFDRMTQKFKTYKHNPADPHSISSNIVSMVHEDKSGILWVALWGAGGLGKMDRRTGQFKTFKHESANPTSLSNDYVASICEDKEGFLWIGTAYGLNKFDPIKETFRVFNYEWHVSVIHEDKYGNLWLGTQDDGLHCFDRTTETFKTYLHKPGDPSSLSSNTVRAIHEDRSGKLWIGSNVIPGIPTTSIAVCIFDWKSEKFTAYKHDPDQPHSLSPGVVWDIFEDNAGVIWIATGLGGLSLWDRRLEKFLTKSISVYNPAR